MLQISNIAKEFLMASVIPTSRQADVAQPRIARWIVWTLLIAGAIANELGIAGGSWDGAYHDRYIVDTFFSPPHILLYSGMAGTMLVGLSALGAVMYEGHTGREWVRLLMRRPLLLLPVLANLGFLATGPFDELWHRTFGRDQLTAWTVPHAILLLNLAGTAVAVAGLALWLRTPVPIGGLAPAAGQAEAVRPGSCFLSASAWSSRTCGGSCLTGSGARASATRSLHSAGSTHR
jgi:hypothetical protein